MEKAVWAGTHHPSFAAAAESLKVLAETPLSAKQVRRIATYVGEDRVAERREQVAAFTGKTLMERTRGVFVLNTGSDFRRRSALSALRTINHWLRTTAKPGVEPPEVGVLMLDNGTHQRRDHCVVITAASRAKRRTGNRRPAAWRCR